MTNVLDWNSNRKMWIRVLEKQTGQGVEHWNTLVAGKNFADEDSLRNWLAEQGVTGYAANLLVMERFGYPEWVSASANELVDAQYADRLHLRPIYEAIIHTVAQFGALTIQTRKTYVSLLTPRRTFARIRPSTKNRLDVGLRLEGQAPSGRLRPCNMQKTMRVQLGLSSVDELDSEAIDWLRRAYDENC